MLDDKESLANNCNSGPNEMGCLAIYSVNSGAVVGVQRVCVILNSFQMLPSILDSFVWNRNRPNFNLRSEFVSLL